MDWVKEFPYFKSVWMPTLPRGVAEDNFASALENLYALHKNVQSTQKPKQIVSQYITALNSFKRSLLDYENSISKKYTLDIAPSQINDVSDDVARFLRQKEFSQNVFVEAHTFVSKLALFAKKHQNKILNLSKTPIHYFQNIHIPNWKWGKSLFIRGHFPQKVAMLTGAVALFAFLLENSKQWLKGEKA